MTPKQHKTSAKPCPLRAAHCFKKFLKKLASDVADLLPNFKTA